MSNIQYGTCLVSSINRRQVMKVHGGLQFVDIFHTITPRFPGRIKLRVAPVAVSSPERETRKRPSPWPFSRKTNTPAKPAFERRMKFAFMLLGRIRLSEKHPEYGERKAYLQKKGFHYDPRRKGWVPDPNWVLNPS